MITLDQPNWPVQDAEPGFTKTVSNFKATDLALIPGLGLSMWPVGFFGGIRNKVPHSSAMAAAFLGGTCGFLLAYQNSYARLAGLRAP
jgi:hypothetical protein|mmetsp:Transcript_36671/g.65649  ORF Transcript_36671/g.65649 Transcript_36671/m.65649 type:complete len:88 (+) Transcript_36671:181-444(+)